LFPALRALGLRDEDIAAVRRSGYLQHDRRLADTVGYCRLRFRVSGRLRTVYVGKEPNRVALVKRELAALQSERLRRRELAQALRNGREVLRGIKPRMATLLEENGYHLHGCVIRKLRGSSAPPTNSQQREPGYGHR
jgi:hypothetical protein